MIKDLQKQERFVIFLDIMGFKDRVARNNHDELELELIEFNKSITSIIKDIYSENISFENIEKEESSGSLFALNNKKNKNNILLAQFSDSIVLFSVDNSSDSLRKIAEAASKIMEAAMKLDKPIPLKGALAEGRITCDMSKQLFFGQALIDAYLLEENVQYYGVVVHHSAEKSVRDAGIDIFRDIEVPLKSGKIKHYELLWYKDCKDEVEKGLDNLRLSVSDSPRKYVDNTRMQMQLFK